MPADELRDWEIFNARIEPIGDRRGDLRMAHALASYMNSVRGKNQRAFTIDDFMFQFDDTPPLEPEEQEDIDMEKRKEQHEALKAKWSQIATAFGSKGAK